MTDSFIDNEARNIKMKSSKDIYLFLIIHLSLIKLFNIQNVERVFFILCFYCGSLLEIFVSFLFHTVIMIKRLEKISLKKLKESESYLSSLLSLRSEISLKIFRSK